MNSAIRIRYIASPVTCPSCGLVYVEHYDTPHELCRDCAYHRWQADYKDRYCIYVNDEGCEPEEARRLALQDVGHFQY